MDFMLFEIHSLLIAILYVIIGSIVMLALYSLPYFIFFPFRVLYRVIFHRLGIKETIYDVWVGDEFFYSNP